MSKGRGNRSPAFVNPTLYQTTRSAAQRRQQHYYSTILGTQKRQLVSSQSLTKILLLSKPRKTGKREDDVKEFIFFVGFNFLKLFGVILYGEAGRCVNRVNSAALVVANLSGCLSVAPQGIVPLNRTYELQPHNDMTNPAQQDEPNNFQEPTAEKPILLLHGDTRELIKRLPDKTFQCAITSPPYWGVRDYGVEGQIGAEPDINDYIADLVSIFSELRRVLRDDGIFWLNIGNTYTSGGRKWRQEDSKNKGRAMSYRPPTPEGLKKKDLIGVAWMLAMACQRDGWYLRNDIIWNKPNCQPESVRDRFTVAHEYLFMFSKSEKYLFDQNAVKEPVQNGNGLKNKRTVWSINTEPCPEAHFAVFPQALVRPCILAGSSINDLILDPFYGAGTVGIVAKELGRRCVGIELNEEYVSIAEKRTRAVQGSVLTELSKISRLHGRCSAS